MLENLLSTLRRDRARQSAELAVAEQARARLQAELEALRAQQDGADAELAETAGALQSTTMDMEQLKARGRPAVALRACLLGHALMCICQVAANMPCARPCGERAWQRLLWLPATLQPL